MNRGGPPVNPPPPDVGPASDLSTLSLDEIGKANRRAQLDGVTAGVCAGFISGQIAIRLLRLSKNAGLLSGLLSGAGAGYVIAQQSLALQLTKAKQSNTDLRAKLAAESGRPKDPWDVQGGAPGTGLELLEDKYNSSSGDH